MALSLAEYIIEKYSVVHVSLLETFAKYSDDQPRDENGRWTGGGSEGSGASPYAVAPRVFNTPDQVEEKSNWGSKSWQWKDRPGMLLTGKPLDRATLPGNLYHVTTAADAVASSGVLLGQNKDAGLGGGQANGVSFTTSEDDARVIQRELTRAVEIAQGHSDIDSLERFAREDEHEGGLPKGALDRAVGSARRMYDVNAENKAVYNTPARMRSLTHDAFNQYLMSREFAAKDNPILKNPLLFSDKNALRNMNVGQIRVLSIPSANIPESALITTGSDDFLHEVRTYSDVPVTGMRIHKAEEEGDHWITVNGSHILIGADGEPKGGNTRALGRTEIEFRPSPKALRAMQARVPCGVEKQRVADKQEATVAKALRMERTKNNSAFDMRRARTVVELKCMQDSKNGKVTMSKTALARKMDEIKSGRLRAYTVVADKRSGGKTDYYIKKGVGSFRLSTMTKVTISEMRKLVL